MNLIRISVKTLTAAALVTVMLAVAVAGNAEWQRSGFTDFGVLVSGTLIIAILAATLFVYVAPRH